MTTLKTKSKKETKGDYTIFLKFNDKTFETNTDDLFSAIMDNKPLVLKTRLVIEVRKGNKKFNRVIITPKARMLLRNKSWLDTLIIQIKKFLG